MSINGTIATFHEPSPNLFAARPNCPVRSGPGKGSDPFEKASTVSPEGVDMSASSDPQSLSSRLERLEQRCQKLGRQCRALKYALAVVFLVALITPVAVLVRTSLGSELRIDTLIADHIILPRRGELVVEGEKPGQPRARLGHFADDHWFGLALFE